MRVATQGRPENQPDAQRDRHRGGLRDRSRDADHETAPPITASTTTMPTTKARPK